MKLPTKKGSESKRLPVAPPVYRPQPVPKVLQQKVAPGRQSNPSVLQQRKPVPPPVYKPQAPPKVLQGKMPVVSQAVSQPSNRFQATSVLHQRKSPVAFPVYRPQPTPRVLQTKTKPAVPPISRMPQPNASPASVRLPRKIAMPVFSRSIQRKINWETTYDGRSAKKPQELIKQLVKAFGEENRKEITAEVYRIHSEKRLWSMQDVWVGFNKYSQAGHLPAHQQVEFAASGAAPLPRPLVDFSLPTVTRLKGRVGEEELEPIRNLSKAKEHAEERFMKQVVVMHDREQVDLEADPKIQITLNNSPCNKKCAEKLANFVDDWGLSDMTVFFGNPYGTKAEFGSAIGKLQDAGIKVHGIDFSRQPSDEGMSRKARERLDRMGRRLRTAKEEGWYKSDSDADDEAEEAPRAGRAKAKSRSRPGSRARSRSRSRGDVQKDDEPRRFPRRLRGRAGERSPSPIPSKPPGRPRRAAAAAAAAAAAPGGMRSDDDSD